MLLGKHLFTMRQVSHYYEKKSHIYKIVSHFYEKTIVLA